MSQQSRRSRSKRIKPEMTGGQACSSCKDSAENPVTCTNCEKLFCWKCFDVWLSFTPRTMCPACVQDVKKQVECCLDHDLELNLYCLTCGTRICSGCFLNSPDHKRHVIDNLDEVYREKLIESEGKLKAAGEVLDEFSKVIEQTVVNEQLIVEREAGMTMELDQLVEKAKAEATSWKAEKMKLCELRKEAPEKKRVIFSELLAKVRSMAKHQFIGDQKKLEDEAAALVPGVQALHPPAIDHYDYECSLIPRCNMVPVVLENFSKFLDDSRYEQTTSFAISDSSETFWEFRIFKGKHLTIEFSQKQRLKCRFQFTVFVEVVHDDLRKTIRLVHETQTHCDRIEVMEMEMLKEQGFVSESDELSMKIGIKPLNISVERQALAMNFLDLKRGKFELNEKHIITEKKLNESERFSVGYFRIPLDKLKFPDEGIQHTLCIRSHNIKDFSGLPWCLYITRAKANRLCSESYISAYIRLNTRKNKRKPRRRFYVELVNKEREYSIRKYRVDRFDSRSRFGWSPFVRMSRAFADNSGFVKNGTISFRFGVQNPKPKAN